MSLSTVAYQCPGTKSRESRSTKTIEQICDTKSTAQTGRKLTTQKLENSFVKINRVIIIN